MTNISPTYEYTYTNPESGHHHNYLLPPLLKLLSNIKQDGAKLRVLDIRVWEWKPK
jgi:hypothetical protein